MTLVVGIDGCRGGWLAVGLRDQGPGEVAVFPHIEDMWRTYSQAALILIDIPIGLPAAKGQERTCDREARRLLAFPRSTSIFPTPLRPSLEFSDRRTASELNYTLSGRRLSIQSWGLVPKIREVDNFLRSVPEARHKMRETHPELLFWALNGGRAMRFKKSRPEGFGERLAVLKRHFALTEELVEEARQSIPAFKAGFHDLLDALAAAVTALMGQRHRLAVLPSHPEYDALGLPMEIVYYRA